MLTEFEKSDISEKLAIAAAYNTLAISMAEFDNGAGNRILLKAEAVLDTIIGRKIEAIPNLSKQFNFLTETFE